MNCSATGTQGDANRHRVDWESGGASPVVSAGVSVSADFRPAGLTPISTHCRVVARPPVPLLGLASGEHEFSATPTGLTQRRSEAHPVLHSIGADRAHRTRQGRDYRSAVKGSKEPPRPKRARVLPGRDGN